MDPFHFTSELLFTLIAVVFCTLIYLKTREVYELTKHKGIKHFRDAFLFLGLSYLLRFFFSLILISSSALDVIIPRELIPLLFILPLGYFSTVAIFHLILSVIWKRFNPRGLVLLAHAIAILVPLLSFLIRSHELLAYLQVFLLGCAIIVVLFVDNEHKKITPTRVLYLLVLFLWVINLWSVGPRRHFEILTPIIQILSLVVFVALYKKLTKWIR